MACIQIRSFAIKLEASTKSRAKQQELLAEFQKFLNINDILLKFGRFDDACQALIERAEQWQVNCRICKQIEIKVCSITFYSEPDKKGEIAVVDMLSRTHNAPHALLSRNGLD